MIQTMPKIKVPAVTNSRLCYQTPGLVSRHPNPMVHCTRPKGHDGPHSWQR